MWPQARQWTGLLTDFYHVDAAYVSWRHGQNAPATFDLYTRRHPFGGAYLLAAGLEPALTFATGFQYGDEEIAYLRTLRPYDEAFLDELRRTRFGGEILAMPEGEVAFANEPLLRVTAPFREALLLESGLLHAISLSTLIATKAARVVHAAQGRPIAEFGYRRAQEPYLAARSAYLGGCATTSFLSAAHVFGIPTSGTVPHALIQLFPTEADAFRAIAESLDHYSFLLDTYDVPHAIETAVEIARSERARGGHRLAAVRLDSGDLVADSRLCRRVLDTAGLTEVRIVASGDLDEYRIDGLVRQGAPIDAFGVGTSLAVGAGSIEHGVEGGALGAVYKLVWYDGPGDDARIKLAGEKSTWPGKKQAVRHGAFERDVIQLEDEPPPPNGRPLLQPVIRDGALLADACPPLAEVRARAAASLAALPEAYHALDDPPTYPVEWSPRLQDLRAETARAFGGAL